MYVEMEYSIHSVHSSVGYVLYRVSIKSFPDYKHLLQENYMNVLELYVAPQKSFSCG
jgi:hypothetical protein